MKRLTGLFAALALAATAGPALALPDLVWTAYTGWAAPIVPRSTDDATSAYAPAPTELIGGGSTYFNFNVRNFGDPFLISGYYVFDRLYVDGVHFLSHMGDNRTVATNGNLWSVNIDRTVRGGRHTLSGIADETNTVAESNEANNTYTAQQWVWSPMDLANGVPLVSAAPAPDRGIGTYPNCDGYWVPGASWGAVGLITLSGGDDFDLNLHNDYADATHGFGTVLASSSAGGTTADFVMINGDVAGYGLARQAGVVRYAAGAGGNYAIEAGLSLGTLRPSTTYGVSVTSGSVAFGANEVLKVHTVYLASTSTDYTFTLRHLSGSLDLNLMAFSPAVAYANRYSSVAASQSGAGGIDETFTYRPSVAGYYGVCVFRNGPADIAAAGSYELRVGRALGNLIATTTWLGWASPVVPRAAADAANENVPAPTTLSGNAAGTWINWLGVQAGQSTMPVWTSHLYLDESELLAHTAFDGATPGEYARYNIGAFTVRGGRHSLTQILDVGGTVAESNESDNSWRGQWVWSPRATTLGTPVVRSAPPERGTGTHPNSDGAQVQHSSSYAFVTAVAPATAGDDYDLYLYDDYTNAQAGFSNIRATSTYGGTWTDFVVGHYTSTTTVFPAAVRYIAGSAGNCLTDQADASAGQFSAGVGTRNGVVMAANRLVDVYEVYLTAGAARRILLTRTAGTSELRVSVFPGTAGGLYGRQQYVAQGTVVRPDCSVLVFNPTDADGWYPLVVCRDTGVGANTAVAYNLSIDAAWLSPVDDSGAAPVFSFAPARPNPTGGPTTFAFSLPAGGPVRLAVYDLRGHHVATLADGDLAAGRHERHWDGCDAGGARLPSGTYYARLSTDRGGSTRRVTLVR
jgi:hypothetical protein